MTVILDTGQPKAVHALVIGVGEYPWLVGGGQPTFASHSGMEQLSSAPVSARMFALWFLEKFSHPDLQHKSLDVCLSEAGNTALTDSQGNVHAIERANMDNVKNAVLRWAAKGQDPDSILLLYFCGHGLGKGPQTILLTEDFGSQPGAQSLTKAIDFTQMYLGLDQCGARRQCCFIDACRVGTPFALNTLGFFGDPILIPEAKTKIPPRSAPIFYSAVPGQLAFGRVGKPSFFTQSLLNAFLGAGADDSSGSWRVETDRLQSGIFHWLRRAVSNTSAQGQLSIADGQSEPFTLHQLSDSPLIPVDVTCKPDVHNRAGLLSISGVGQPQMLPSVQEGDWKVDLPFGKHRFDVALPAPAAPQQAESEIRPPFRRVEVVVP